MEQIDLKNIVREVLGTPEFVSQLRALVQVPSITQNETRSPTQEVVIPSTSTPMPGVSSVSTPLTRINELRRLFPSIHQSRRTTIRRRIGRKNPREGIVQDFKKDVFLVSCEQTKTLKGFSKVAAYDQGFGLSAVTLQKDWSLEELYQYLKNIFQPKLLGQDFEILLPISGTLVKPNLSPGEELNGENISRLFHQKIIYLRTFQKINYYNINPNEENFDIEENNNTNKNPYETVTNEIEINFTEEDEQFEKDTLTAIKVSTNDIEDNFDIEENNNTNKNPHETVTNEIEINFTEEDEQFEKDTLTAIKVSINDEILTEIVNTEEKTGVQINRLNDLIKQYEDKINESNVCYFNIYREDVFNCCLRALRRNSFSPFNKISVLFTDIENISEGAIDAGGPLREMFRLLLKYLQDSVIFEGAPESKNVSLHSSSLQNHDYYDAGRLIYLGLIHCGAAPKYFSETLFSFLIYGIDEAQPVIEDINNESVKFEMMNIINSTTEEQLREAVESSFVLDIAGLQTITQDDLQRKDQLLNYALKYYVLHRTRPALEQFKEGLNITDFLTKAKKFPSELKKLLCYNKGELTFSLLNSLFKPVLSEEGSNKRYVESKTLAFWRDYLLDCEDNSSEVKLKDILAFATASETIPPLGFNDDPTIKFIHEDPIGITSPYPKANTCALILYLPTMHTTYDNFKSKLDFAILNGMVFGYE